MTKQHVRSRDVRGDFARTLLPSATTLPPDVRSMPGPAPSGSASSSSPAHNQQGQAYAAESEAPPAKRQRRPSQRYQDASGSTEEEASAAATLSCAQERWCMCLVSQWLRPPNPLPAAAANDEPWLGVYLELVC